MATMVSARQTGRDHRSEERQWPVWPLHLILGVLFLGPLISPLFRATELPLIRDSGLLARELLATYVCPTPAKSYMLAGFPMAVCARCWGATIGLLLARLCFTRRRLGSWAAPLIGGVAAITRLPWHLRLLVCALPFLLWPLEIIGESQGIWSAPFWLLLLNGVQAGCAAGIFFCSIWPGLRVRDL